MTLKMMVYWTKLSLFLFSFVFPLVVLFFDSVFSVCVLWSLSLFVFVPVPVLFASLSTGISSVFPVLLSLLPVAGVLKEILQSLSSVSLCLWFSLFVRLLSGTLLFVPFFLSSLSLGLSLSSPVAFSAFIKPEDGLCTIFYQIHPKFIIKSSNFKFMFS
jgi:hypothetical protein